MKSRSAFLSLPLLSGLAVLTASAQGPISPDAGPDETMKSLQEIWDELQAVKGQNEALDGEIENLKSQNTELLGFIESALDWGIETVDSSGDITEVGSLAFTQSGQPAMSYYDGINDDLKYAQFKGASWMIETIDGTGNIGLINSLAFNPSGQPAIGYIVFSNGTLRYAERKLLGGN